MQPSRRNCLCALLALLVFPPLCAPQARANTLTITSSPTGATVEIDGVIVGTTPFHMKVPGGYFHKTRTVFGQTLQHQMTLRIYKDGYTAQDLRLTEGPFEWVAMNGRTHVHYWLLKADHIEATLEPVSTAFTGRVKRTAARASDASDPVAGSPSPPTGHGEVAISCEVADAEVYVDGKFVGQTPSTLQLASGTHHIEVRSEGRREWERDLEVLKDSQLTLHPVLGESR